MKLERILYLASTHWDREWYQPFDIFRFRLTGVLDEVLDTLDADPDFTCFVLDGQSIPLRDYLEIRPENEGRIRNAAAAGRLAAGPWYTMPDQLLVSGESLVRNLLRGRALCRSLGAEPMACGYVCDCFGHTGQLPQILKGFGIAGALLGRGTNAADTPAHFRWRSPDGSEVTAFKVPESVGYGSFYWEVLAPFTDGRDTDYSTLTARAAAYVEAERARSAAPVVVLMDGMDHEPIHAVAPRLARTLAQQYGCPAELASPALLPRWLESYDLPVKSGELLDTTEAMVMHSMLIPHTLSSRYDIKRGNDLAQTELFQTAEPLRTLSSLFDRPSAPGFLQTAVNLLLENQSHDSICGCSIDEVHRANLHRFERIHAIAGAVTGDALRTLVPEDGTQQTLALFNPLPQKRLSLVTAVLTFPPQFWPRWDEPGGTQPRNGFLLRDAAGREVPYALTDIRRDTFRHNGPVDYRYKAADTHTVRFLAELPPSGYAVYTIEPCDQPVRYLQTAVNSPRSAENPFIALEIEPDGTLTLFDKRSGRTYRKLLELLDEPDMGDGWHHVSVLNRGPISSQGAPARIELCSDGPDAAVWRVTKVLTLPAGLCRDPHGVTVTENTVCLPAEFLITFSRAHPYVDVALKLDNTARDHRLRLRLPTGINGDTCRADGAYAVYERTLSDGIHTGRWKEVYQDEWPFESMALRTDSGGAGLCFLSGGGLHGCQALRDRDGTLLITLMRCFSKTVNTDGEQDGQLPGLRDFRFRILPVTGDETDAELLSVRDDLAVSVHCLQGKYTANTRCSFLTLESRDLRLTALKIPEAPERFGDAGGTCPVLLRLCNYANHPAAGILTLPAPIRAAWRTDLRECAQTAVPFDGQSLTATAAPCEIVSYVVLLERESNRL